MDPALLHALGSFAFAIAMAGFLFGVACFKAMFDKRRRRD